MTHILKDVYVLAYPYYLFDRDHMYFMVITESKLKQVTMK
jgi:uncharacterized protein YhbP (UPF0306 family)